MVLSIHQSENVASLNELQLIFICTAFSFAFIICPNLERIQVCNPFTPPLPSTSQFSCILTRALQLKESFCLLRELPEW